MRSAIVEFDLTGWDDGDMRKPKLTYWTVSPAAVSETALVKNPHAILDRTGSAWLLCGMGEAQLLIDFHEEVVGGLEMTVRCAEDVRQALQKSTGTVTVVYSRDGKTQSCRIAPQITAGGPKLGLYLRQGITGIGTVTWYDPETGALCFFRYDERVQIFPIIPYDENVKTVKVTSYEQTQTKEVKTGEVALFTFDAIDGQSNTVEATAYDAMGNTIYRLETQDNHWIWVPATE